MAANFSPDDSTSGPQKPAYFPKLPARFTFPSRYFIE
jgi:hypothetical protein